MSHTCRWTWKVERGQNSLLPQCQQGTKVQKNWQSSLISMKGWNVDRPSPSDDGISGEGMLKSPSGRVAIVEARGKKDWARVLSSESRPWRPAPEWLGRGKLTWRHHITPVRNANNGHYVNVPTLSTSPQTNLEGWRQVSGVERCVGPETHYFSDHFYLYYL